MEFLKIDGDTDPFLKSGKILNQHAAPARICIFKKYHQAIQLRRNSIFVAEKFFLAKVAHLGGRKEKNFE